jgi:hypothetical protein
MMPDKGEYLLKEIKAIYPQLKSCSYATTLEFVDSLSKPRTADIVFFEVGEPLSPAEEIKVKRWLEHRLKSERLILRF